MTRTTPADAERMAAAGFVRAAAAAAYVCRGSTCQAPVTDPEELGRPLLLSVTGLDMR